MGGGEREPGQALCFDAASRTHYIRVGWRQSCTCFWKGDCIDDSVGNDVTRIYIRGSSGNLRRKVWRDKA